MTPPSGYVGLFIDQATGNVVQKSADGVTMRIGLGSSVTGGTPTNSAPTDVLSFPGLTAPAHASEPMTKVVGVSEWTNDGSEFTVWTGNPAQKHLVREGGIWRLYQDEVVIAESEDDGATNPWETLWYSIGPGTGNPTPIPVMSDATPGNLGDMMVDSIYLYVVSNVTNSVPTWKKISLYDL